MTNSRDVERTPIACRQGGIHFPPRVTNRKKMKKQCGVARGYTIGDIMALSQNLRRIIRSGQPAATAFLGLIYGETEDERLEKLAALLNDQMDLRRLVLCRVPELIPRLKKFNLRVTPDDTRATKAHEAETTASYSSSFVGDETEEGERPIDCVGKGYDDGYVRWVDMRVGDDD